MLKKPRAAKARPGGPKVRRGCAAGAAGGAKAKPKRRARVRQHMQLPRRNPEQAAAHILFGAFHIPNDGFAVICRHHILFYILEEKTMLEKIIASVAEQLAIDPAKVTKDSNLIDDLKADSLDIAALMLDLEEQYGIEIPDEELANLRTVGDIAAYLEARQ